MVVSNNQKEKNRYITVIHKPEQALDADLPQTEPAADELSYLRDTANPELDLSMYLKPAKRNIKQIVFSFIYGIFCIALVIVIPGYIVVNEENMKIGMAPVFGSDDAAPAANNGGGGGVIPGTDNNGDSNDNRPDGGGEPNAEVLADETIKVPKSTARDDENLHTVEIVATGTKNDDSNSSEIWLLGIEYDGITENLATIPAADGWDNRTNTIISYQSQPCGLKFDITFEDYAAFSFTSHEYSGIFDLYVDETLVSSVDLFRQDGNVPYVLKLEY